MPFAAAVSEHPVTAYAIGEATGQVLEQLGDRPDLAILFVSAGHAGALEDAAAAVRTLLAPRVLLGCAAAAIVGNGQEVEFAPGVTLWAGRVGQVAPLRLAAEKGKIIGWPGGVDFEPSALLLLADPNSFPAEQFFKVLEAAHPGLPVIGGMASGQLIIDDAVLSGGAVGVLVGSDVAIEAVVSQGCRPIGQAYTVTGGGGQVIEELGGRPPVERLQQLANHQLTGDEVTVVRQGGLHLGRVVDESKADLERGDFLVRDILAADPQRGTMVVNDEVELGATFQFHLRDPESADDDLRQLLRGREADGALMFTCNGRGQRYFGEANHDARLVDELLGKPPAAGVFCAGEFGPVGGRNFVHGCTASVALFRDKR